MSTPYLSTGILFSLDLCSPVCAATHSLCVFMCPSVLLRLEDTLSWEASIISDSYSLSTPSSTEVVEGRGWMETSHLGLGARSLSLFAHYSIVGLYVSSHLLQEAFLDCKNSSKSWLMQRLMVIQVLRASELTTVHQQTGHSYPPHLGFGNSVEEGGERTPELSGREGGCFGWTTAVALMNSQQMLFLT